MAKTILFDAFVSINGVDLSDHVKSVELDYTADTPDSTTMKSTPTRERISGLRDWSIALDFTNDYAAASVDATLFPLMGQTFAVILRPAKASAVSATNPNYSGTGILSSYKPLAGAVGDVLMAPVSILGAGVLSRLTS